jgi:putative flippase GtrA
VNFSFGKLLFKDEVKVKFVLVGLWNTIFGYLVFFLLDTVFEEIFTKRYFAYMSAMTLGQIIATVNAFIFHRYFTFRSNTKGKDIFFEFFRFCLTYVITFSLSLLVLPFIVEIFNIHPRISGAIAILITAVVSYFGHSRFSFNKGI